MAKFYEYPTPSGISEGDERIVMEKNGITYSPTISFIALNSLGDVDTTGLQDGDTLIWSNPNQKWEVSAPAGGSSSLDYGNIHMLNHQVFTVTGFAGFETGFSELDPTGQTGRIVEGLVSTNISTEVTTGVDFIVAAAGDYKIDVDVALRETAAPALHAGYMTLFAGASGSESEIQGARIPMTLDPGVSQQSSTNTVVTLSAGDHVSVRFSSDTGVSTFTIDAFKFSIVKVG